MEFGAAGRQAKQLAIFGHQRLGHLQRFCQPGMLGHVAHFAMHRNGDAGTDPAIHLGQLVAAGMPRNMDVMVFHRQKPDAARRQLVLHLEDGELIAGNDAAGKDHRVAIA